jgi:outer membrane protein OmpA-like peptidoglycan-associated protein
MRVAKISCIAIIAGTVLSAQVPNPTQRVPVQEPQRLDPVPVFRIEVVARSTAAVNYLHRGGSTKVDFQGTPLLREAHGTAKVESERGVIKVTAEFKDLAQPSSFGPEYLTYVLWAISPDGRPVNMGELTLDSYGKGSSSKIETTSEIQTFGLIVTAEPYYAVTQPSDLVVLENVIRPDTRGVIQTINAKYELLPRGTYTMQGRGRFVPIKVGKHNPFELFEAQNAVQLARLAGADRYAPESFQKAVATLEQAERYQVQKPGQKPVITMAREAAVRAEDSRVIAIRRQQEEALANERQAAQARENAEREKALLADQRAAEEARQRALADADRLAAERSRAAAVDAAQEADRSRAAAMNAARDAERLRIEAERQKNEAELARQAALKERQEADAARQAAQAEQQKLALEVDRSRAAAADADRLRAESDRLRADADRLRNQAEMEKTQLRQQLLDQFNAILQTRDSARGLIVNMSDVLFDVGRYTLRPGAREKLAKVAGIILGHPGLRIEVEGHTDSTGGDEMNMKLSENRAKAVREYLVAQGVRSENVNSKGFGKTMPVADNGNAAGRQMNRRVELVVSGEVIGTRITSIRTSSKPQE